MKEVDFAVGWPIKEEDLFLKVLKQESKLKGIGFSIIYEKDLERLHYLVKRNKLKIKFFLDMASDSFNFNDSFTKFVYALKDSDTKVVADPDSVKFSADKSITHFNLLKAKIPVPYTIVIRHWESMRQFSEEEREKLGFPFVVKPALGYGQKGVAIINQKFSLKEIAKAREFNLGDNFLLQEFVEPVIFEGRPAWFRVFYIFGEIFPCWWNPQTNEYKQVSLKDFSKYRLSILAQIISEIGRITRVEFFSSEIALNKKDKRFVVVDYMNDQCALYPKSQHADGVPDELITLIGQRLVSKVWDYLKGKDTLSYRAVWFLKMKLKDEDVV